MVCRYIPEVFGIDKSKVNSGAFGNDETSGPELIGFAIVGYLDSMAAFSGLYGNRCLYLNFNKKAMELY